MDVRTDTYNILYVDDEEHNLNSFRAALRRNYNVYTALSGEQGMEVLSKTDIHVIITDQRMPNMTGVQFLQHIPGEQDNIRMILTGFSDMESIIDAINTGKVYRYITKPWDREELKITIDNAIETIMLRRSNKQLISELKAYNELLEEKVRQRTLELQRQADEIQLQNEQIQSQAEEIQGINENLELLVKERTAKLEKKNQAAEESAFIIAHELRSPVASILGLINLAAKCDLNEEAKTIVTHMESSGDKLNTIVRNITEAIERGDK
ncbi:MAG: response regulator [Cyclobacteriaceae bacterium]|nr:response regulator [Cyclobacteriaceae bacterium]MDH4294777.1 response regulator [Cyclobacteriaceae bacterium]MDH5248626.1 response regulator [Cyclobacteriaceae bacterium]